MQKDKNVLLLELKKSVVPSSIEMFVELTECLLEEARTANDEARGDDVLINQGKIQVCRYLLAVLKSS